MAGLPKVKTHTPVYIKKLNVEAHKKVEKFSEANDVPRHAVWNAIVTQFLGIEEQHTLDLTSLKGNKE